MDSDAYSKRCRLARPLCKPVCCPLPCPKIPWLKLGAIFLTVFSYHFAKVGMSASGGWPDTADLAFLAATSIWLSTVSLVPSCLRCHPRLRAVYDVFAATVLSHVVLSTVWREVLGIVKVVTALVYRVVEENSFLADYLYDWLDPEETTLCLPQILAMAYLAWVIQCLCVVESFLSLLYYLKCKFCA